MLNRIFCILVCVILQTIVSAQSKAFVSFPSLSPDGKIAYFSYESDIWSVELSSGHCSRITSMQGLESRAKVSPDGKWIAFTSTQFNNADVYLVPSTGGNIQQLTWSDGADLVEAWSWDSKTIYFSNNTYNRGTTYTVGIHGGTPKRVFNHYFNTIHHVTPSPNGELYFNDTGESSNQSYRKGYKGPLNPEIQSYHLQTGKHTVYTNYEGKDMWATVDQTGKVYFVSDEYTGQYNLFTFINGKKTQLTNFKNSIKYPSVSANGEKVVFIKDYQLWVYNVKDKTTKAVKLNIYSNAILSKDQSYDINGTIRAMDVAPDDKKMAFVSRGRLFISDIKGKFISEMNTNPKERILEVKWINKDSLIATQTVKGYPNLFLITPNAQVHSKQLTFDTKTNRDIVINKDRSCIAFISGRDELKIIDLKTLIAKSIVKDEFWGFQNDAPRFSPDGRYVMYCAMRDFEKDVFVHELSTGKNTNITATGVTEGEPQWSPDGDAIFFTSDRMTPSYPFGLRDGHIYKLPLTKTIKDFKSDKYEALWKSDKKSNKDSLTTDKVEIDITKIMERIEMISPSVGTQRNPHVLKKDEKTIVYYISNHDEGKSALWKTEIELFERPKTSKIADMSSYNLNENDKKIYILTEGKIGTINNDKIEFITISHTFSKNNLDEFEQMFEETWAGVEENFYNESFHGKDWKAIKNSYASYLPMVSSRADFREMMQDMLGELNSSHTGFSSSGKEESVFYKNTTVHPGILWEDDRPYTVKAIIPRSPADISKPIIQAGDILMSVNGQNIDTSLNRDSYFTKADATEELILSFMRGKEIINQKFKTISSAELSSLLYEMWIDDNQQRVDQLSNNEIAYVHMRNMSLAEYDKFVIDMTQDFYKKKALIVDIRYNTGGNVHDKVLNFLAQKPYLKWKYREGAFTTQPNFGPAGKPIILLTNEQSLSDAEMTTEGFKSLGLGKVIGTDTYRWIIFTSGKSLVDGSFYRLPSWGCYSLDGQRNLEETGVSPDIYVKQTMVQRLNGEDPQIQRAVEEIKIMWKIR